MKPIIGICLTIGAAVTFLVLFWFSLGWAVSRDEMRKELRTTNPTVISKTEYGDGTIYTVKHDGHWFVIHRAVSTGSMLHHLDCPCGLIIDFTGLIEKP